MADGIRAGKILRKRVFQQIRWYSEFALRRLRRPLFLCAATCFLIHSDRILPAAPLAAAFFAAALTAGDNPLPLCVGCALGAIRVPVSQSALVPAVSCALTLGGEFLFSVASRLKACDRNTRASIIAGVSSLIPAMAAAGGDALASVEALACASVSAAAAPFLLAVLNRRRISARETRIGVLLLAVGTFSGLAAIHPVVGAAASAGALVFAVRRCAANDSARIVVTGLRRRMIALGDAFGEMAEGCASKNNMPGEQELLLDMREKLCTECVNYTACWAGGENRAARLLCRLIGDAIAAADAPAGNRILYGDGEIPPDILRACRRGRSIPDRLGLTLRGFSEKRRSEIKRCATGRILSVQLRQAQTILHDLAAHPAVRSVRDARYRADAGVCCQSGIPGETCGDSCRVCTLEDGTLALMLSDGMGTGDVAAAESREALRLLVRFLRAGISRDVALETLNQQMLMRTGEDIFATVDLCVLDLYTGEADFSKLAACRTLILRGREIIRIEGGRLPLGILEHVEPVRAKLRLKAGDLLIMGSDGVMESGVPIEQAARLSAKLEPGAIAERLVREAAVRRGTARTDDLTCICARVCLRNPDTQIREA